MLKHIRLKYVKHIKYIDKYINYKRKYKWYFLDFNTGNILYKWQRSMKPKRKIKKCDKLK